MLPPMAPHEIDALKASLLRGWDRQKEPILTFDGMILDGRHRFEVCRELGIEPEFAEWSGDNPFRFVWEQHDARRNWRSAEQRQLCYDSCDASAEAWDAERQQIQTQANQARSEAAKGNRNAAKDRPENSAGTNSSRTVSRPQGQGRAKKAAASGTVLESVATRCALCGAQIVAVRVQTDTGVSWGAVEFWCGSYRPHECDPVMEVAA